MSIATVVVEDTFVNHWARERDEMMLAIQQAEDLFAEYPEGVDEHVLICQLAENGNFKLRQASAAVDRLESRGKALKDWSTGFLSHP